MTKAQEAKYEATIKDQKNGLFNDTFGKIAEIMNKLNDLNKRQLRVQDTLEKDTSEKKDLKILVSTQTAKCNEYIQIDEKLTRMEQNHNELRKEFDKKNKKRVRGKSGTNSSA